MYYLIISDDALCIIWDLSKGITVRVKFHAEVVIVSFEKTIAVERPFGHVVSISTGFNKAADSMLPAMSTN